jgi:hypothetical protein
MLARKNTENRPATAANLAIDSAPSQIWPPTSLDQAGDIVTINGFFSHKVKTL